LVIVEKVWQVANKREILNKFAKKHGFDALISDNWYKITELDFRGDQVCFSIFYLFICNIVLVFFFFVLFCFFVTYFLLRAGSNVCGEVSVWWINREDSDGYLQ
jgi:hypothetical protein